MGERRRVVPRSVRVRTTVGATLVVGVALALASIAMVLMLEQALNSNVQDEAEGRAEAIAEQLIGGTEPSLEEIDVDEAFVQVLDDSGAVVASTQNAEGIAPVELPARDGSVRLDPGPLGDMPFVVVGIPAATEDGPRTVVVGRSLEDVDETLGALVPLLVIGVPVLTGVVGIVTWVITGRALAPVESIRAEVETISAGGLDRRVPEPGTGDEIDRLAVTMNGMLARLDRAQIRQRRFVADAAHELRSPVAAIRQHTEVATEHPQTTDLAELAGIVHEENRRVEALVNDLLLLVRLDTAEHVTTDGVIELDELVREEAARAAATPGPDVMLEDGGPVVVRGRTEELRRALRNLLDNAVRHARTAVVVACRPDGSRVLVTIDDDGPGVPEVERDRVFERFVRLDEARSRDAGGVGLGLAIARSIAEAHGGSLTVGDSPSGGARFELVLERGR